MSAPDPKRAALLARLRERAKAPAVEDPVEVRLRTVRELYRHGVRFIPLVGKVPRPGVKGFNRADYDHTLEESERWAREGNIGIVCGRLIVLDIDELTPEVEALLDTLPNTVRATTGKGSHLYFLMPPGMALGNATGALPKGIDVRGAGGYVVAPGSVHPDTGKPYVWADGCAPWEIDFAPLAESVVALIKAPKRAASRHTERPHGAQPTVDVAASNLTAAQRQCVIPYVDAIVAGELEKLSAAQEGTRNSTLNNVALRLGHLVGAGLIDEDEITERLSELAEEIGLEPREIEATIRSGMSAGIDRPEDVPALIARLDDVPSWFGNFVRGERTADRTMPDDSEAENLVTTTGGNGRPKLTARAEAARKVIKKADLAAHAACFEIKALPPEAEGKGQSEQLALLRAKVIEPVVAALVPDSQFDPSLAYALTFKLTKDHGAPGWREPVWQAVLEAWDRTEADLEAQRQEHERAEQERAAERGSREGSILAGQCETFVGEEIPTDPDEAASWSLARLMFKAGSDYYLIDAWTGHLSPQPYSRDQLSRAIEEHGLEIFIPLTEMRGKVVAPLSGQEIVNRARPWAVSRVTERVGLKHPLLERDGKQYVLVLPQYEIADIEPEFSADIDALLAHTYGDRAEDFRDWLATVPEVALPTRALVIEGPPGMGKDIIPTGCAQVFKHPEFTRRAFERFNGPLATNPVVFLDEGLPGSAHGGSVSEKFREMISGGTLPIEQKGKDIRSVEVRPRVIIATNDLEKVVARLAGDRLNRSSTRAVEDRILAVRASDDAADYLNARGNWQHTRNWCDPSKRLFAKHVLWLHRERIERLRAAGTRFLGQPSSERLLESYVYDDPLTIAFVETVCRLVARHGDNAALVGPGEDEVAGLYLQRSALEQTFGAGLGKDRSAPDAIEIESAGARAGLLDVPRPKVKFKLKGKWSQLNSRAWRTVTNWQLVHEIAQRNGDAHLAALERFLVSIGVLAGSEYGCPGGDERSGGEQPVSIFDRAKTRQGGQQ